MLSLFLLRSKSKPALSGTFVDVPSHCMLLLSRHHLVANVSVWEGWQSIGHPVTLDWGNKTVPWPPCQPLWPAVAKVLLQWFGVEHSWTWTSLPELKFRLGSHQFHPVGFPSRSCPASETTSMWESIPEDQSGIKTWFRSLLLAF